MTGAAADERVARRRQTWVRAGNERVPRTAVRATWMAVVLTGWSSSSDALSEAMKLSAAFLLVVPGRRGAANEAT